MYENPWIYQDKPFSDEEIGNYVGFVYRITNLTNDMKYIGKKIFYFSKKRQVNKRKRRYKANSNWKEYYGSCEPLLEDINKFGVHNFKREILYLCECKKDMTYYEIREQFMCEVLEKPGYYNTSISGRFYLRDKTKTVPFGENILDFCSGEIGPGRSSLKPSKEKIGHPSKGSVAEFWKENISHSLTGRKQPRKWTLLAWKTRRANAGGEWHTPDFQKQRQADSNSEIWEIIHPNGSIEIVKNLKNFCKNNGLQDSNLIRTKTNGGHLNHHKGFRCRKPANHLKSFTD